MDADNININDRVGRTFHLKFIGVYLRLNLFLRFLR